MLPAVRIPVLLPLPLAGALDYLVPDGMAVAAGDIVVVTLNGREHIGVAWDGKVDTSFPAARLKPVRSVLPEYRLAATLRQFVDWVAAYTLSPLGDVLAMTLRVQALASAKPLLGLRISTDQVPSARLTPSRRRVLDALGGATRSFNELCRETEVSMPVLRGMLQAGLLETAVLPAPALPALARTAAAALSQVQAGAAAALVSMVEAGRFTVTLLQGATGSGKTEVYFEAVRACVEAGRQALILLPEIALSAQWLQRFERRFGAPPLVWHSDLSARIRRETWQNVASGRVQVLVGARSALFLPFDRLGLIIVDEEHETAYKQEDGVIYHARDMAVVRARLSHAAAVLVSATPSLETLANVEAGRYARLDLPQRFGGAALPTILPVDLRQHPPPRGSFLSPVLVAHIGQVLARGEQAMLFLNRRGYAPLTLCRRCGFRISCPNCTAWLVEHRLRRVLCCHHCGHSQTIPLTCVACCAEDSLAPVGPGVERITEEVAELFPQARRLIMASDTLPGPQAAAAAVAAVERREIDLLIGTQVAAKGWHFPHLTLVGVVDADLGLSGGDLRAAERTMQLLHQVAGRAGREQAVGTVLLQTYQPEHPVIRSLVSGDLERFMQAEAAQRRPGHWPPYGRLVAMIVSAESAEEADAVARALGRAAPEGDGIAVLGPAPAPLALLRGRHRRRLLLRTTRNIPVQPLVRQWLAAVPVPRRVRVDVDIDPISFL